MTKPKKTNRKSKTKNSRPGSWLIGLAIILIALFAITFVRQRDQQEALNQDTVTNDIVQPSRSQLEIQPISHQSMQQGGEFYADISGDRMDLLYKNPDRTVSNVIPGEVSSLGSFGLLDAKAEAHSYVHLDTSPDGTYAAFYRLEKVPSKDSGYPDEYTTAVHLWLADSKNDRVFLVESDIKDTGGSLNGYRDTNIGWVGDYFAYFVENHGNATVFKTINISSGEWNTIIDSNRRDLNHWVSQSVDVTFSSDRLLIKREINKFHKATDIQIPAGEKNYTISILPSGEDEKLIFSEDAGT